MIPQSERTGTIVRRGEECYTGRCEKACLEAKSMIGLSATSTAHRDALWDAGVWMGVLLAVLMVGTIVVTIARRKLLGESRDREGDWTIADVRRLRETGLVDAEECERLTRRIARTTMPRHSTEASRSGDR